MSRARLVCSAILLMFAIMFTFKHHLGYSVGDTILSHLGVSPYTKSYISGVHVTFFVGIGLIWCGYYVVRRELMQAYPRLAKKLWLVVLLVIVSYPYVSDKMMYLTKWGATGMDGVYFVRDESSCIYNVQESGVTGAACTITLKNYGRHDVSVALKPDLARTYGNQDDPLFNTLNSVELGPVHLDLKAHAAFSGRLVFKGQAKAPFQVGGRLTDIVFDVTADGKDIVLEEP